ncbi:citrate lyase subunit alpha, partial [Salmonella enterica]|uniref:citrate lyase subunit alpha n=1 Tax=Salmonella enterica TaxID=28901 RepID=UPI0026661568
GYAQVDAQNAKCVVLLTVEWVEFPKYPASIAQDQFDFIVQVDEVGDPEKITAGEIRLSSNPRELLIARQAAYVIEHSGYFCDVFSLHTGTGGASLA